VLRLQSAALTAAANAILITDRDGAVVWVNPAFTTMTGYTLAEAIGKNPRELVKSGKEERALYQEMWETILAGRVWHGRLVNRRKDGSLYPEEQTITPVRGPGGEITHFIAIKQDLTERLRAEEKLHLAHERLRRFVEANIVGIVISDPAGNIIDANDYYLRLVGYSREELAQGKLNWRSITPPEWIARSEQAAREVRECGVCTPFEKEYLRRDGTRVPILLIVAPLSGPEEQFAAFALDLTRLKQAEAALRQSERRYRVLFENSPDVVFSLTSTGVITSLNSAFETITGWPPAGWLGKPFHEIIHPGDLARAEELFQTTLRRERVPAFELRVRTAAGGYRDIEFTGFASPRGAAGVEVHGIGRDVTARKLIERELRERNEILSNSHEGVMIVGLDNKVSFWNPGAENLFGWTAAEALGRAPEQLLGVDDPDFVAALRAAVQRDGFWSGELRAQARDGRKLTVECRTTLVRDDEGRPRARLNLLADITDKKLFEEKFLHAQRLESIGLLAAGIAHDLNNVLAPILFVAPMLRENLSTPRDLRILATLEQSATRGAGLVKQILGFVHSAAGELRPTQVKHLLRDITGIIEQTFPKSIELRQRIPSDLWPVRGNPTQIHQVLLNLCVNARDAMPQGGTLSITAANRRLTSAEAGRIPGSQPGDWLMLEIMDTGTGMPPEVVAHIWEPFFTTKSPGKGTGLGLSTVRGIVANHHGFVEFQTAVGRGTTFRVFLPAFESEPPGQGSTRPFTGPAGHNELIVIVDDDAPVREIVAEILGTNGYRVVRCADGVEAMTFCQSHADEISLVVTDIDMPHLGGVALARALLQIRPEIKLIAISGLASVEAGNADVPAARKLVHAFLPKPFAAEALLDTVRRLLHPAANS
jgi:PAS domain S-box-containing protein